MNVDTLLDGFDGQDWQDEPVGGTVRLAVVGLGWFARQQALPSIDESDHCETTVMVGGSPEKAEAVRDEHDAERALTYEAFHDGQATDAYDAVYVNSSATDEPVNRGSRPVDQRTDRPETGGT